MTAAPDVILHHGLFTTLDRSNPTASAVAISGARHQRLWRRRSKTAISSICAHRKARPEAAAILTGASTAEATTATANPTHATRRAWPGPSCAWWARAGGAAWSCPPT